MGLTATITVVADHDAWIAAAANIVRSASRRAIETRGHFSLVLSGGSTPAALYEHLAHQPAVDQLDWAATSVYFGDERCVPPGDPASNFTMAATTLLDLVPVPPAQVHRHHEPMLSAHEDPRWDRRRATVRMAKVWFAGAHSPAPVSDARASRSRSTFATVSLELAVRVTA